MTRNTRQQIDDLQRRLDAAHAENVRLKSVNEELRRTNMTWIKRYREALGKYREADTGLDALRSDLGRLATWFNAHPQMRSGTGTVDDALAHLESHVSECLPILGVTHETGETIANRRFPPDLPEQVKAESFKSDVERYAETIGAQALAAK